MSNEDRQSMSSSMSSRLDEDTILVRSSPTCVSSALHESVSTKTSAAEGDKEEVNVSDITPSISPPSSPIMSYYQDLALKLRSGGHGNCSVSIVSDNPFSHSSLNGMSTLPPLYEYNAMDEFLPSLLKDKGLKALSIVSDHASSTIPDDIEIYCETIVSNDSEEVSQKPLDEQAALDIVVEQPFTSSDVEVAMQVNKAIQEMDRHSRVGRSSSYNAIYSTPKAKPKRSVARARSFQGLHNKGGGTFSPLSTKSPQSVLDFCNPTDAAELRRSFATL